MNKFNVAQWHKHLKNDFDNLIKKSPARIRRVLLRKSAQLIADDSSGCKLCLAAALTCDLQLPTVAERTLRQLHLLYLCSWLSYAIYDDVNDGETNVHLLPVANYLLFMTLELSRSLGKGGDYQKFLLTHLKEMELANYEELHLDELSPYPEDLLFKRASGQVFALHVLSDEWKLSQLRRQQLFDLMRSVIAILQIQDDLRDYLSDYSSARRTFVNQGLFQQSFINEVEIKVYFYQNILPRILSNLELRLQQARHLLSELSEFDVQDGFFKFFLSSREKILINDKSKSARFNKQLQGKGCPTPFTAEKIRS